MRVIACSGTVRMNEMTEDRGFIKTELKYHKFGVHDFFFTLSSVSNEYWMQTAGE
jgi:hypothetical protein